MRSSYIENNYGEVLYRNIMAYKPTTVVELGTLDGYSTYSIAKGLQDLHICYEHPKTVVDSYDLWDEYKYKHGNFEDVSRMFEENGLSEYAKFHKMDAMKVHELYPDNLSVCFLHVDISNNGDIFNEIVEKWHSKIRYTGCIVFEGGSEERDKVEWMIKYNKKPIKPEIEKNKVVNDNYYIGTYLKFPSLTVLYKFTDNV